MRGRLAAALITAGVLLHGGIAIYSGAQSHAANSLAFSVGLFLWASSPYVACAFLLFRMRMTRAAAGAALLALLMDITSAYTAFVKPSSSTSSLVLLFVPLWNLLVACPIGGFGGWLLSRRAERRASVV